MLKESQKQIPPNSTDEDLLEFFSSGNIKGFNEIVRRYEEPLRTFIYRYNNDKEDSRDVSQDTFIMLFKYKDRIREIKKLSTWLYTVALNNAKRKINRSAMFERFDDEELESDPDKYHNEDNITETEDFDVKVFGDEKLSQDLLEAASGIQGSDPP